MRTEPTLRIPLGLLGLLIALAAYALSVLAIADWLAERHIVFQTVFYVVAGTIWLLPLRGFLSWMETGSWRAPDEGEGDR